MAEREFNPFLDEDDETLPSLPLGEDFAEEMEVIKANAKPAFEEDEEESEDDEADLPTPEIVPPTSSITDDWGFDDDVEGGSSVQDWASLIDDEETEDEPTEETKSDFFADDWGFEEEESQSNEEPDDLSTLLNSLAPDEISAPDREDSPSTSDGWGEDDWDFGEEEEQETTPPPSSFEPEWDFEDEEDLALARNEEPGEEVSSWGSVPEAPKEKESELSSYLDSIDQEEEAEKPLPVWKAKLNDTWAQIKSEMRGGDEPPAREESEGGSGKSGILDKVLFPYHWLASMLQKLILLILSPLKKIPPLARFAGPNVVVRIVSYLLPLALVIFFLQWQGSKPLPPAEDLSFPDEGSAEIVGFSYDEENDFAKAEVTNTGAVIAEVRVTFEVESIQRSFNPLSFFFPEPNEACSSEPVRIGIDETATISAPCPIEGSFKKMTGGLEWTG